MGGVAVIFEPWDRAKAADLVARLKRDGWSVVDDDHVTDVLSDNTLLTDTSAASCVVVLWSATSKNLASLRSEAEEALRRGRLVSVTIDRVKPPQPFSELPYIELSDALAPNDIEQQRKFFERMYTVAGPAALVSGTTHWNSQEEQSRWARIENSSDPSDFGRFMQEFPNSVLAAVAHERASQIAIWRQTDFRKLARAEQYSILPKVIGTVVVAAAAVAIGAGVWTNWDSLFPSNDYSTYEVPAPAPEPSAPPADTSIYTPPDTNTPAPQDTTSPAPSDNTGSAPPPSDSPQPTSPENNATEAPASPLDNAPQASPSENSPTEPVCSASGKDACEAQTGCVWIQFLNMCSVAQPAPNATPPATAQPSTTDNNECPAFREQFACELNSRCTWLFGQCYPKIQ